MVRQGKRDQRPPQYHPDWPIGIATRIAWQAATRVMTVGLAVLAALPVMGCGAEEQSGAGSRTGKAPATDSLERGPVVRNGQLVGQLIIEPSSAKQGGQVRVAVRNLGRLPIYYGLDNLIQRRTGHGWKNANEAAYGTRDPRFPAILLTAEPGYTAGPAHNGLVDQVPLPSSLPPGRYRITKDVNANHRFVGPPRATLHVVLTVRRPDSADPP